MFRKGRDCLRVSRAPRRLTPRQPKFDTNNFGRIARMYCHRPRTEYVLRERTMFGLRTRPKDVRNFASFVLGLSIFALMPTEAGYQDIGSLLARQSGAAERWQKRVSFAAANVQLATYSFGRPIGTSSPQLPNYQLASLDKRDITGSITRSNPLVVPPPRYQASDFPKVDRTLKGDRLVVRTPAPVDAAPPANAKP